ncbi:sensor histidine kinase KdpD [uncultured Clostridium sp.]|uniref:sensor histidine kinase n=1 Tax=uncultured Clostridium sp. TaxID=59620 RepID=UPI0025F7B271|nr:HAMP domain-containing sensor histidine kinase [uncultured Clostridium sp.]
MDIINCILLILIIILICFLYSLRRKIKYMCLVLDDVINGNLNQRIRFQNKIGFLNELTLKINGIIEKFQVVNKENIYHEESQKRMISNISHDLRTPLTSMLGYMELIFERDNLDQTKKKEYLKIIYDKGNFLYDLMEEFFQVSKLDSNDINLNFKNINLSEIIRQNIISFFSEIQKLNIEPEINIGEKDIYLLCDEKIMNRILNNLINNSLKHGTGASKIGINLSSDSMYVYIEVWDNGSGIAADDINHIFDRLYTAEKSRSAAMKSSGLGLTIVKKLVESLEGSIVVKSTPFKKTSFLIKLPNHYY